MPSGEPSRIEAAKAVVALDLSPADKARADVLAAKARAGMLSPEEMEEVEAYSCVGSVVGILKAKAYQVLESHRWPNGANDR